MGPLPSPEEIERLRRLARAPDLPTGRYRIDRELAHGGLGTVYLAFDHRLQRPVAIKTLHPGEQSARLLAEARTLALLEHPSIMPVHDAGTLEDGRLYFVMKYVAGQRLDEYALLAPLRERLRAFVRIVEAIAFAHSRGIPHRDLKPHNIMVGPFGEVLVLDWGQPGAGTPGWLAPEHAQQAAGSLAGDIFSLGMILHSLITGDPPRALLAIAAKAAHPSPLERYPSAEALLRDLNRFLDLDRVDAFPESWWQAASRLARRHRLAVMLVASYLILRILLIIFRGR